MLFVSLFQPHYVSRMHKAFSCALFNLSLSTTLEGKYHRSPFHRLANTSSKRTSNWPEVKYTKCQNFSPELT